LLPSVSSHRRCREEQGSQVGMGFKPKDLRLLRSGHKPKIGVGLLATVPPILGATVSGRSVARGPHLAVVTPLPSLAIVPLAVRAVPWRYAVPANSSWGSISGTLSAFSARREAAGRVPAGALMGPTAAAVPSMSEASAAEATLVVPSTALGTFSVQPGALTGEVSLFSAVVTCAWCSVVLDRAVRLDEGVRACEGRPKCRPSVQPAANCCLG
jgi:hypothetical protein